MVGSVGPTITLTSLSLPCQTIVPQVGLFVEWVQRAIGEQWAFLTPFVWLLWQFYGPKLGFDTRFNEIVSGINDRMDMLSERLADAEKQQEDQTTALIALANAQARDRQVQPEDVSEFLDHDEVTSEDLIRDDKSESDPQYGG